MVILVSALNRIRDLIVADVDKGQLGTGGTAVTENDTGLLNPESSTLLTLDDKSTTSKTIKFDYKLPSTGGTSVTFREFELVSSSESINYDRVVFTGVNFTKGGTEDFIISKKYFIKNI